MTKPTRPQIHIIERRSGEGRRTDDGQTKAVQRSSDYHLAMQIYGLVQSVVLGAVVLGTAWIIKDTVTPFAGKVTDIQASITISAIGTLTVSGLWGFRELKMRNQRAELKALRLELEKYRNKNGNVRAVNSRRGRRS